MEEEWKMWETGRDKECTDEISAKSLFLLLHCNKLLIKTAYREGGRGGEKELEMIASCIIL